ncbi:AAA family ATPase [Fuerstiella marisgermanici]|uniref:ATP-dependent protease n=1 Tax=Fuerstiella marisgermanici TaxID=1891926 RepID=A0A1P8WFW7_9PLAN|nr:MoxR family ATPase [Fuerstiella marisgermanici]APZ92959.1 ATP-dependent protease [Fuerstiella marisgermanici]
MNRLDTQSAPKKSGSENGHAASPVLETSKDVAETVDRMHEKFKELRTQLSGIIVGQDEVAEQLLIALLCKGHCILQGMPGLAKTMLVSTMASLVDMSFRRVQFTPDLMPGDITGTEVLEEDHTTGKRIFRFVEGPLFGNVILADEINRTPPKTQSALLEAMQERQLTVCGQTYKLPEPFFVLATQNPVETEGTYPLPEAQLDRFLLKIHVTYPSRSEELEIARRQTTDYHFETKTVLDADQIQKMQSLVRNVVVSDHVYEAALDLVRGTRPEESEMSAELKNLIQWGAGPRATIAVLMAAKARALLNRRCHATTADIIAVAQPVLRHRVILTFNAEAAGIDADSVLEKIIQGTKSLHKAAV